MKCDETCKYFMKLGNTDECGQGICSYPDSWTPVEKGKDCAFEAKQYTCGDCDRLCQDDWCLTCRPEDTAYPTGTLCMGFIDKQEVKVQEAVWDWINRGKDVRKTLDKIVKECYNNYRKPGERK